MINIYDISGNILLSVPETEGCEHVAELMNSDYVKLSFVLATGSVLPQGAYVIHKDVIYRLYEPYKPERNNEVEYKYEPKFHSKVMGWIYKPFFFLQTSGGAVVKRESDWTLTGTVTDFLNRVVASIADETGESYSYDYDLALIGSKTIQFQASSIIDGLNAIAEAWESEWWVLGSTVRLSRCAHSTAIALTVGVNIGVPTITRSSDGYYTRFYAFGSARNIPQDYTSGTSTNHVVQKRLTLPVSTCPNGYKDIRAGLTPIEINSKVLIFDEIYPKSSLSISSIRYETRYRYDADGNRIQIGTDPGGDPIYETYRVYFFQIAGFTFDITSIIEGKTLALHFESGNLAGWDFDLAYHSENSEFEIILDESTGYILPNEILAPSVDDLIVLFNVLMPSEYTASAEAELEEALDVEIEKLTSDVDSYEVNSYPVAFQSSGISLTVGRNVNFTSGSTILATRVLAITEKLDEPYTVRIRIGEKVTKRVTKKLQEEIIDVNKAVEAIASRLINVDRARRNWQASNELLDMVFDADGYFDGTKIRPESIETMMLRVGSRSQQLSISCVITPNYGGDPNSVNVSAGALANYGIADTVQNWNISPSTVTLTSSGAYYIYAKCSKVDAAGAVIFSQTQITVDEDEDFYHFLLGVIHSVDDGVRWISLTYGATVINGRYIRTGVIISQDGLNFFNLDEGKFKIGNELSGLDWNETQEDTLTLRGVLVQSGSGTTSPLPTFTGAYDPTRVYYKGEEATYNGSTWRYVFDTPLSGREPGVRKGFGSFYNWFTVDDPRNLANTGWHVISYLDFVALYNYCGGPNQGRKLCENSTDFWNDPSWCTNEFGLNLRGGGWRHLDGVFYYLKNVFYSWIRESYSSELAYIWGVYSSWFQHQPPGSTSFGQKTRGYSVCLVKDSTNLSHGESGVYIGNDGRVYKTICIGSREFVAEPLAETKFRTGDNIPEVTDNATWAALTTAARCGYNNDINNILGIEYWVVTAEQSVSQVGAVGVYQGLYSDIITYYGNSTRVDIVKFNNLYYITRTNAPSPSFKGIDPTNTSYWRLFGANFESVATQLLMAETAYLNNVIVRKLEGVPVSVGSLSGTVANTQANSAPTPRIDYVELSGSNGSANILCNGLIQPVVIISSIANAIADFVSRWYYDYLSIGVIISEDSVNRIIFTESDKGDFNGPTVATNVSGDLSGGSGTTQLHVDGQKRIDTISLAGTGGIANITCNGLSKRCVYNSSPTATAAAFVAYYAADYLAIGVVVTSSGADLIFTALNGGEDFTGATTILTVTSLYSGAISIEGNDLWDNVTNSDQAGLMINMRGYQGGDSRYRSLIIGNGKGNSLLFVGRATSPDVDAISFEAGFWHVANIPRSSTGLVSGQVYADANGFLKIAP